MCDELANDSKVYGRVFQVRAEDLSWKVEWLNILGLITPLSVGAFVLIYSTDNPYLDSIIRVAFIISLVQLLVSGYAIAQKWNDNLAYYYEAMQDLSTIGAEFIKLKNAPNRQPGVLGHLFEINRVRYDIRLRQNLKYNVTATEVKEAETHFINLAAAKSNASIKAEETI